MNFQFKKVSLKRALLTIQTKVSNCITKMIIKVVCQFPEDANYVDLTEWMDEEDNDSVDEREEKK
jgi:hypothetical protein